VHPYLDHDGPLAIVHRGGAAEGRENTMSAFVRAVELGFTHLETDVHATADGVLVAFHDDTLDRVTDTHGRISRLPYATVARARVGGVDPVPRLVDLLEALPDARLNIDVKHQQAVLPAVMLLRSMGVLDRVCVASFSDDRLSQLRRALGDGVCSSLGPREVAGFVAAVARRRRWAAPPGARCLQVPARLGPVPLVTRRFVAGAHAQGLAVHVWTVDEPAEMDRLLDLGVDGLITDRPLALKAVLQRRGQWTGRP
jgi:glycerophosphoryl diester phosphodiesterase